MADALWLDPEEYLENRLAELSAVEDRLPPAVYQLAENTLRDCVAMYTKVHRLSSEVWLAKIKTPDDEGREGGRHKHEMDSALSLIERDVQFVKQMVQSALNS